MQNVITSNGLTIDYSKVTRAGGPIPWIVDKPRKILGDFAGENIFDRQVDFS